MYFFLILFCSLIIFYKIRKIYSFSKYKGLRYFANGFLFLAIAFCVRFTVMLMKILEDNNITGTINEFNFFIIATEFTMVLPGLFFGYSLLWKKFEKEHYGLGIMTQIPIYILALTIALIDYFLKTLNTMYISQIILFFSISVILYYRLKQKENKNNKFMLTFFVSMILFFFIWILNFIAQYTINFAPMMRIYTYILTTITCFVMLYLIINLTKNHKKSR